MVFVYVYIKFIIINFSVPKAFKKALFAKHIVKPRLCPVIFVVVALYPKYTSCYTDVVSMRKLLCGVCLLASLRLLYSRG